jgi:hypothetical protein
LGELVIGILAIPIGFLVAVSNSWPKCEPSEDGFTFGPCSDEGPSQRGQAVGTGISVIGGIMVADGIRRMATASRNLPGPPTPAAADSLGLKGGRP